MRPTKPLITTRLLEDNQVSILKLDMVSRLVEQTGHLWTYMLINGGPKHIQNNKVDKWPWVRKLLLHKCTDYKRL